MRNKLAITLAIGLVGIVSAQEYKSRLPKPDETRKVAGVTDFIQDGPRFNVTPYSPGNGETVTLNATNNFALFFGWGAGQSNFTLFLPNPTNAARRAYLVDIAGRCSADNICVDSSVLITTSTNIQVIDNWVSPTNCTYWLFNNNRTAWHIVPIR